MRKLIGSVAFVALIAIIFSCASDIVFEDQPSLKGVYKGRYIVTELGENPVEWVQNVDWQFKDISYHMDVDMDNATRFCICNVDGRWVEEEKIRLEETTSLPPGDSGDDVLTCTACDDKYNPVGFFVLFNWLPDSLKLTYVDTLEDLKKEIKLYPVSQ